MKSRAAEQVFSSHLAHLLCRSSGVRPDTDEFESVVNLVHLLLESESNGKTSLEIDADALTENVRRILSSHPLVLEEVQSGAHLMLYTARTHAALKGVWNWFSDKTSSPAAGAADERDGRMIFEPESSEAGGLRLDGDDQIPAILKAAKNKFTVITGGPGTGKTTIIAACIAELLARDATLQSEQIVLCAPTGKAAQRLTEGIVDFRTKYLGKSSEEFRGRMLSVPDAVTLHALLGSSPLRVLPVRGEIPLLAQKVVVVDECSMVSAELMCSLVRSLDSDARLILVGDADQLPSVECGSVFRDIVGRLEGSASRHIHRLTKTRRSGQEIIKEARKGLTNGLKADFQWEPFRADEHIASESVRFINGVRKMEKGKFTDWLDFLLKKIFQEYAASQGWSHSERGLNAFKIITARREGTGGVHDINQRMNRLARSQWNVRRSGYLVGEPVMVTENIHYLGLNNGDVGIVEAAASVLPFVAEEQQELQVRFSKGERNPVYPVDQLIGRTERSWASTCHKAQGSEYGHVFVVLPDRANELVTGQWLYTAMTRAKSKLTLISESAGTPQS